MEESFSTNEEEDEEVITSKSILTIGESLPSSKAEVKKPLMENTDDLNNLEVLEDLDTTCVLKEAALC